jgi:hypothetical protein
MANILFVGYDEKDPTTEEVKIYIGFAMRNLKITDAVITPIETCPTYIGRKDNHRAPYIIIRSPSRREIRKIIRELKRLRFCNDVEWEKIGGFIPGSKMNYF